MKARFWVPLCGAVAVAACTPKSSVPDGTAIVDEVVALERQAEADVATRIVTVDGDALLVAIVDENLTDVRVRLSVAGGDEPVEPVEVENNLEGAGTEIAAVEVPHGARVTVTLTGPPYSGKPGSVHLRLRQYSDADTAQVAGYRAWSAATAARFRNDAIVETALPAIDRAIASFREPQGDAALAAEAQRVKANMYYYFMIDVRKGYEAATQSVEAYQGLAATHALPLARARLLQAFTLSDLATNPASKNPSASEANALARQLLTELAADPSPLGTIERARAISALAVTDRNDSRGEDSKRRLDEAMAMYQRAGYTAGEFTTLAQLAQAHVERGEFPQAARAYQQLLPDIDRIPDPKLRVSTLVGGGRALGFMGRTEQGIATNLQALALAREYDLKSQQGEVAWELAWMYWFRGDFLQAKALFAEALKVARSLDNNIGVPYTLASYGTIARYDGDYQAAIEMHQEAKQLAGVPTQRIRTMRGLAMDYAAVGRYEDAVAELRAALAVDVQDPNHHIFTDIKYDLAELLARHGDGSAATYAEASRLAGDALRMAQKMEDPYNQIGSHRVRALLHMKQGKAAAARADFDRAFALAFKYRDGGANAQLRMQSLEQEQLAFRDYFDLMMRGVVARGAGVARPAQPDEEDALRTLERARQSHLGFARQVKLDAESAARMDALMAQMADTSLKIAQLADRKLGKEETASLDALQKDMIRLRLEVDGLRISAARKQTAAEAPESAKARAWRAVPAGSAQLSYALGNEHAYVWIRDAGGLRAAVLGETPEKLERRLAELASFDTQEAPDKVEASLESLSSVLLPQSLMLRDTRALEIIAEGRIASVAFAGLRSPTDPARRLVETHAVTFITSMHAADLAPRPAQARPFRLVALASGTGKLRSARAENSLPKLQSATAEIQTIADLFTARDKEAKVKLFAGRDGSAAALRGIWSSGADVVHFATHAQADLRQPLASLLVLPAQDAAGAPAYLTAGQVQDWRGDADLVFLSACESAIGPPRFAGGMPGLQSAFLRAGARGVIATLWPIEDVLAREFSADFYRRYTAGADAALALSETQRAWLSPRPGASDAEQRRRRVNAIAHVYFAP
jgi:CHAT domain-containing protein